MHVKVVYAPGNLSITDRSEAAVLLWFISFGFIFINVVCKSVIRRK